MTPVIFFFQKVISSFVLFIRHSEHLNDAEQARNPNIKKFIEYFEKNYVGKIDQSTGNRKIPRFPIDLWNVHNSTIEGMAFSLSSVKFN